MYPFVHGNYCGAFWSDGKFQASVKKGGKPAIDAFDRACEHHDSLLASGYTPREANRVFSEDLEKIPGVSATIVKNVFDRVQFGEPRMRGSEERIGPKFRPTRSSQIPASLRQEKVVIEPNGQIVKYRKPLDYFDGSLVEHQTPIPRPTSKPEWEPLPQRQGKTPLWPGRIEELKIKREEARRKPIPVEYYTEAAAVKLKEEDIIDTNAREIATQLRMAPSRIPVPRGKNKKEKKDLKQAEKWITKAEQDKKMRSERKNTRKTALQAYRSAPVAKGSTIVNQGPSMSYKSDGAIRIRHRENLGEVVGASSTFAVTNTCYINPGMSGTFPFLATIAQRYDKYRIHALRFYYETECATSITGSVLMTFDYNCLDVAPVNKIQMSAYTGAVKTVPWLDACCVFNSANMQTDNWIRSGTVAAQDQKTYDPAIFYVAETANASGTLGDLWIEYDITLRCPSEQNAIGGSFVAGGTVSNAAPFGTQASATSIVGNIPGNWSGTTFTFTQTGTFLLTGQGTGTLSALTNNTGTVTVGNSTLIGNGTNFTLFAAIVATPGQTFIYTSPTGTITAITWFFAVLPVGAQSG